MTGEVPLETARLPHGYTNATRRFDGTVRKSYLGPDPQERLRTEQAALTGLFGRFPVPRVLSSESRELRTTEVVGWHGQEVLDDPDDRRARSVLRLCGRAPQGAVRDPPATVLGLPGSGEVIVHGDFEPQNMLVSSEGNTALAVFDWEWAHLGAAIEDLAWTEWIVRTHHPHRVPCLDELFAGYGARPAWSERKAEMLLTCQRCREFCRRWKSPDAVALWDERITATEAFRE